jgi:glycosyltransferase involved in cell wall biosynthesis
MTDTRIPTRTPKVGIGMPVYNGADYLRDAIESVLNQTFEDFELLICDNASTDKTPEICLEYAEKDSRVRYLRNRVNLGGGPNHRRVFELSRGKYYRLFHHDDAMHPELLARCVEVLDANPEVVCAFPSAVRIGPDGKVNGHYPPRPAFESDDPMVRAWEALRFAGEPLALFGLVRSEIMEKIDLPGSSPSADRVWVAELAMHGPFREVPEPLFLHREYPGRSMSAYGFGHATIAWWDPKAVGTLSFPYWRTFRSLVRAIRRAPLSRRDRLRAYQLVGRWAGENQHYFKLLYDLAVPLRPLIDFAYRRRAARR